MKKTRTKIAAAGVPVPQSREAAALAITRIGELQREVGRIQADLDDEVGRLKQSAEEAATPLRDEVAALIDGLRTWAEAHRETLTDGGKTKTADLGTGRIMWRLRPPRVTVRGAEAVIEHLRGLGLLRFIRESVEVDKEAMLREPDVARGVPGITVGSAGEDFVVEPLTLELVEGSAR